jgi:hypothetical protein
VGHVYDVQRDTRMIAKDLQSNIRQDMEMAFVPSLQCFWLHVFRKYTNNSYSDPFGV